MPTRSSPMSFRGLTVVLGCAALTGLVGCASGPAAQRDAAVRDNPTPELETLSERPIDVDNVHAITFDENLRMANEDLNRLMLFDRPSRLSRWRMPH